MIAFLLAVAAIFLAASIAVGYYLSEPGHKGPRTDNFNGKRFINPGRVKSKGFLDVIRWMSQRRQGEWRTQMHLPPGEKPVDKVESGLRITFVNHSTFLIQVDGLNILTDPVWSERTSPFTFAGPKRMRPPGIRLADLPDIHVVLLSHNHYDHLDIFTVRHLVKKYNPKFILPLGVGGFFRKQGLGNYEELDWWQVASINDSLQVESVPAQHFSGRGTFDRDATLWCGFVLKRRGGNLYYAGDTGYNDSTFKEIGERSQPQTAIIPIGAYQPQWFMRPIHCSPEEAVKIHLDLKASKSIATHFGTFPLADDGFADPVADLQRALEKLAVDSERFVVLKEGVGENF